MNIAVKNRIWIEGREGTFIGNGRIRLLEKIAETGSINEAAKALKMSYRKAWALLESMNTQAKKPFIIKKTGGKKGGGTQVTAAGLEAIRQFRELNEKCRNFLDKEVNKLSF